MLNTLEFPPSNIAVEMDFTFKFKKLTASLGSQKFLKKLLKTFNYDRDKNQQKFILF